MNGRHESIPKAYTVRLLELDHMLVILSYFVIVFLCGFVLVTQFISTYMSYRLCILTTAFFSNSCPSVLRTKHEQTQQQEKKNKRTNNG